MKAFDRNTNLDVIRDVRNLEKIALDDYIDKVIIPLRDQNSTFCETLYKDIVYILKGIDKPGDNDLLIEHGDFVVEDGDFKLTGYQTRLHNPVIWLHMEIIKKIEARSERPDKIIEEIENFNDKFLTNFNFTTEYKTELDKIKESIKKERRHNYEPVDTTLSKFLDADILELKPNIMGLGINLNELINRLRRKTK